MTPASAPAIKVLVVDDQRAMLAGVRALIETETPRLTVAGLAQTGAEALALARDTNPRVIVLDVDLGGEDGLDLVPRLRPWCHAAIVLFTCLAAPAVHERATRLGVKQLVPKGASGEALLEAIVRAAERRAWPRASGAAGPHESDRSE